MNGYEILCFKSEFLYTPFRVGVANRLPFSRQHRFHHTTWGAFCQIIPAGQEKCARIPPEPPCIFPTPCYN